MNSDDLNPEQLDFYLEQLDPRATLIVLTNATTYEGGFIRGEVLRERWEHKDLAQVGSRVSIRDGWWRCLLPYEERCLIVKFLSPEFQLLDENTTNELGQQIEGGHTMAIKKSKKGGAKAAAANVGEPKAATKPAASKAAPAAAPAAKPAAPAAPKAVKPAATSTEEPKGYPWGMNRLKNEVVKFLTPEESQAQVRKDLKDLKRFEDVRSYANAAGINDEQLLVFLDGFFARCANH